jgi:hypothetical protein
MEKWDRNYDLAFSNVRFVRGFGPVWLRLVLLSGPRGWRKGLVELGVMEDRPMPAQTAQLAVISTICRYQQTKTLNINRLKLQIASVTLGLALITFITCRYKRIKVEFRRSAVQ